MAIVTDACSIRATGYNDRKGDLMKAYQDLQTIVDITVSWERELNDLYDVASYGLQSEDSQKTIAFLKERQEANLEILENLDVSAFGGAEWVKFPPNVQENDLVPKKTFSRSTAPDDILEAILSYEQRLHDFYRDVYDKLVGEDQKDLFDSLARFRDEQMGRIRNFMKVAG